MFAVIAGYFSTLSGYGTQESGQYIWARYSYFLLCGLFINILYGLSEMIFNHNNPGIPLRQIISESLLLGSAIFPTFWFVPIFFMGSILCFAIGRLRIKGCGILLIIIAALCLNNIWIAIYLMGSVAIWMESKSCIQRALQKWWIRLILFIIIFIIIKRPESNLTYFIDGVCSLIFILLVPHSPLLSCFFIFLLPLELDATVWPFS